MTAKELMKQCEAEEKELKFREFSSETALAIGMALIEEAKKRDNKICIDIAIAGRRLFHYSSDGNAVSNDIMIERKKKTAMHTGHSSLWAHYMLEERSANTDYSFAKSRRLSSSMAY